MSEHCDEFREKLENMISLQLSPEERDSLEQHLADCPECRNYHQALKNDDQSLGAFAASMEGLGARIEDAVFRASDPDKQDVQRKNRLWGSPAVHVAAAAAVIAAIVLVSSLFDSTPRRDVVWAEVFEKIDKPPTHISEREVYHDGRFVHKVVMYRSPDLGFRNDIYKQDVLHSQSIFSFKSKTAYHVYLNDKVCIRDSLGSEAVVLLQQNTVLSTVQRLRGREHISLGISEIEGTVVTGIEIVDTVLSDRGTTIGNIRVYVDVDTQWPVLIEGEGVITKREGVTNHRLTRTRYQWQPQLTPEDFTPDIPEDFFVADTNEPIDHIIERAIRGLRNFALMTGRYPEHPDFGTLRRDVATELEKLEQTGAYSPEIADSLDVVLYAGVLFNWHDGVRRYNEAGEFKYYDSSVTPSDTGKVLYRWRMDDKIGIIYGDLRFGTGDASEFAEFDRERYKLDDQERRIGPFDPSQ